MCWGRCTVPAGIAKSLFTDVRVPKANVLLGEGRGFEIAQGRLGPGRIHHAMRLIGMAQRALELMCRRADSRVAFGRKLSAQGMVRAEIANSFCRDRTGALADAESRRCHGPAWVTRRRKT